MKDLDGAVDQLRKSIAEMEAAVDEPRVLLSKRCSRRIARIADLTSPNDNRVFLDAAFNSILGREPDDEARTWYLAQLQAGTPRQKVIEWLVDSDEARRIGVIVPELCKDHDDLLGLLIELVEDQQKQIDVLQVNNQVVLQRLRAMPLAQAKFLEAFYNFVQFIGATESAVPR